MHWVVAGLIAGVIVYFVDYIMWGKVFTKGLDVFVTPMSPEEMKRFMGPALVKSGLLALVFGVLFAWFFVRFRSCLWVHSGSWLAGMEFGTVLWLPTIFLATIGSSVWYMRARPLHMAMCWSWLVRVNAAGFVVGLLTK